MRAAAVEGYAPSPDALEAALAELPGELVDLGWSLDGEPVVALRMGAGERALRVVGGMHGDEASSAVVALEVARALASRGVPPGVEVWIVPALNPDGLRAGTRVNAAGVDLNRNFGWRWRADATRPGPAAFSEPEARALRALARARDFAGGVSLHAGATNFGWVWNWTSEERPAEETLFEQLGEAYAGACGAPGFWTTNGGDWYVTAGEMTDWAYGSFGSQDFTVELTEDKAPPEDEVATYVAWHLEALLALLERPPDRAVRVVDAETGEAIPARIASTTDGWTGPDGRWSRWGPGDISASAHGYAEGDAALVPVDLVPHLPSPRLLSRGLGPQEVAFPGAEARLVLPGEPEIELVRGEAGWRVDPALLAPGAWTVVSDAGVAPRSLFVGEVDDTVEIEEVSLDGDALAVTGRGFGRGTEVWSIGGPARAMHPLPRRADGRFTLANDDDDLLVWTGGAWLAVLDVHGEPRFDVDAPSRGAALDPTLRAVGACQAAAGGGPWWLALLALSRRARGACGLPSTHG